MDNANEKTETYLHVLFSSMHTNINFQHSQSTNTNKNQIAIYQAET